jgi:hypothetical protein
LDINNISDQFIFYWVLQACVTNIVINGMMTLYAVHMRRTNQHEADRAALARDIDMSPELDLTIRTAILVNSFAGFCATTVQIPNLPGIMNKQWQYLAYNPELIIVGIFLAGRVSFLSQYALSSESDVFEREARKREIEHKQDVEMEERTWLAEEAARFNEDDEMEQTHYNIYEMKKGYDSFGTANGNNTSPSPTPSPRESFVSRVSRYVFFRSTEPQPELVSQENAAHFIQLRQDVNNRFSLPAEPEGRSSWCSIM